MIEVNAFKSDEEIREYLNKKYINLYNNIDDTRSIIVIGTTYMNMEKT